MKLLKILSYLLASVQKSDPNHDGHIPTQRGQLSGCLFCAVTLENGFRIVFEASAFSSISRAIYNESSTRTRTSLRSTISIRHLPIICWSSQRYTTVSVHLLVRAGRLYIPVQRREHKELSKWRCGVMYVYPHSSCIHCSLERPSTIVKSMEEIGHRLLDDLEIHPSNRRSVLHPPFA